MQFLTPKTKITCPYCKTKSEHQAQDYLPKNSTAVHPETCTSCDQQYLVRRIEDGHIAVDTNWTQENLYSCRSKPTAVPI